MIVDDVVYETQNGTIELNLAAGQHTIKLAKEGYISKEIEIHIKQKITKKTKQKHPPEQEPQKLQKQKQKHNQESPWN